jgi:hydroxyethylthiazole kinase-like uncharacterized protein yjeF
MQLLEKKAEKRFGIPTLILMENAGRSVAEQIHRDKFRRGKKILVICGQGNNGGDGLVAARHLQNFGYHVRVLSYANQSKLKPDTALNMRMVRRMGIPVCRKPSLKKLRRFVAESATVVDALFGTGLSRDLNFDMISIINEINRKAKHVVSIDVPSGIDADAGVSRGAAVRADQTVTLGIAKHGLFKSKGRIYAGRVVIGDISFPNQLKG